MSDNKWWDELQAKYSEARRRLAMLPENSFTYEGGGVGYAHKRALYSFNNAKAADRAFISDFDLMVMYDGNPCFGGHVERYGPSKDYPNGCARITVYTD